MNSTVVAFLPPYNFSFNPPDDYCVQSTGELKFGHSVAMVLNLIRDGSIDWTLWKKGMGDWATGRKYQVHIPRHPLDTFAPQTTRARAFGKDVQVSVPSFALMPWIENRTKMDVKLSARVSFQKIRRLIRLPWAMAAAGVFPRTFKYLFDEAEELSRFCVSMLWGSYFVWDLRSRLEFQVRKRKEKSQRLDCRSPYHSLQPLESPNVWMCACPRTTEIMAAPANALKLSSVIQKKKSRTGTRTSQQKLKRTPVLGQSKEVNKIGAKRKRSVQGRGGDTSAIPVRRSLRIRKQART